ncbi:MAG: type II toxin-antitoxin system HicA family toxin [Fimbriimonadales bacterium]
MSGKIKRLNAKELEALLLAHAFELVAQRGSHRKWWNRAKNIQLTVPMHGNRSLPIGTLRQILALSEIPPEQWRD